MAMQIDLINFLSKRRVNFSTMPVHWNDKVQWETGEWTYSLKLCRLSKIISESSERSIVLSQVAPRNHLRIHHSHISINVVIFLLLYTNLGSIAKNNLSYRSERKNLMKNWEISLKVFNYRIEAFCCINWDSFILSSKKMDWLEWISFFYTYEK